MSANCYRCGAPHEPKKPHRDDFDSEVAYLLACLEWLDYEHPERQEQRALAWLRLDTSAQLERVIPRLRELLALDRPFDVAETAEWDELTAIYRTRRRIVRPTPDTTEGNES